MKKIILVFIASFLFFYLMLSIAPGLLCPDSFYHIKMAEITAYNFPNFLKEFPWLNFTIFNSYFTDHHLLFHLLSAPFVLTASITGMKIFISLTIALFFTLFYWLLKKLDVKHGIFWLLLLITAIPFLYRLFFLRAISFSLILIFLGFYFLKEKKHLWIFIISLLFTWSYGAFITILIMAFAFTLSTKILTKKKELKLPVYSTLGIFSGVIINPYFPNNLTFLKIQLFQIPFTGGYLKNLSVGAEWYPINISGLIEGSLLIWLVFSGLVAVLIYYRKNFLEFKKTISKETLSAIMLSIFFFILTVKSQRFIEYWVPFTVLAGALTARDFKLDMKLVDSFQKLWQQSSKGTDPCKGPSLLRVLLRVRPLKIFLPLLLVISIALIVFSFSKSIYDNYMALKNTDPYDRFKSASEWLIKNTPEKSIIYNVSWDEFPELFYWNTHNYYIVGMDPTFLYEYDKKLHKKYQDISEGKDSNQSKTIKESFNSKIIFAGKKNKKFIDKAGKDLNLEKTYEDNWSIIYKIK